MKKVLILLSSIFMAGCFICHKDLPEEEIEDNLPKEVIEDHVEEIILVEWQLEDGVISRYTTEEAANFAFDSREPLLNEKKIFSIMEDLKAVLDAVIYVEGHTDNVGSAAYNNKLSLERARAVKNILLEKGVSADKIHVQGAGFSKPIASNDTKEGRAKNRRVDITVKRQSIN